MAVLAGLEVTGVAGGNGGALVPPVPPPVGVGKSMGDLILIILTVIYEQCQIFGYTYLKDKGHIALLKCYIAMIL